MSRNNLVVERENKKLTMSRVFDAPRQKVWEAFTDPGLIVQWWGPSYLTTTVDKMELKPGGAWRFVQRDEEGNEYGFRGEYIEVVPPEKLTYTFEFEPMAGHVSTDTITLAEQPDGRTKVVTTTVFDTVEDLDGMIQSGMEDGANESWDRLTELVEKA